jgi:hypothetical protein
LGWWQRELFGLPDNLPQLPARDVVVDLFAGTGASPSVFDPVHVMEVLHQQLAADPDQADAPAALACDPRANAVSRLLAAAAAQDRAVADAYRATLERAEALIPYLLQVRHLIVELGAAAHLYVVGTPFARRMRQDRRYPEERISPSAFTPTSFITPNGILVDQPAAIRANELRFSVDSVLEIFPLGKIRDVDPRLRRLSPYAQYLRATAAADRVRVRGGRPRSACEQQIRELFLKGWVAGRLVGNANAIARLLCDEAAQRGLDDVPQPRAIAEWVRGWLDEIRQQEDQRPEG